MSLRGDRLVYRVGRRELLNGVSLEINAGELVAVLGPNGAGKTTLLKLLSGDLVSTAGEVMLNHRRLRNWSRIDVARQRAVLPQQGSLTFPFDVREVVEMGRSPYPRNRPARDAEIVEAAMEAADVAHLAERNFLVLSGGERQRVHLARVLAQIWADEGGTHPRFLLLDEPTSALDLAHQHQVLQIVRRISHDANIGALAVLHDLNLASTYADRLLLLEQGRLVMQGQTDAVLNAELLTSVFRVPMHIGPHPLVPDRKLVVSGASKVPTSSACLTEPPRENSHR
jgi:iron complex transport system ATP-binding protein